MEAEYMALSWVIRELLSWIYYLTQMGVSIIQSTITYMDNQTAISLKLSTSEAHQHSLPLYSGSSARRYTRNQPYSTPASRLCNPVFEIFQREHSHRLAAIALGIFSLDEFLLFSCVYAFSALWVFETFTSPF